MQNIGVSELTDQQLLDRTSQYVLRERKATVEVIRHVMEVERRKLYLSQACSTSWVYLRQLGYSEDEATKRVRVARIALVIPQVFEELEGHMNHMTGLFLLSKYLTPGNASELLSQARGKTRMQISELIARRFPKPDVPDRVAEIADPAPALPLGVACPGPGAPRNEVASSAATCPGPVTPPTAPSSALTCPEPGHPERIEPLSGASYLFQFTGGAEHVTLVERARELTSHSIPSGKLAAIFLLALRELVTRVEKRLMGSSQRRKQRREQDPGSRYTPVELQREIRERDGHQCTFVDAQGRRCTERRFLTVEHRDPFALGGPTTKENCCLYCAGHNAYRARQVFGDDYIARRIAERRRAKAPAFAGDRAKVHSALINMGYKRREADGAVIMLSERVCPEADLDTLIRAALVFLSRDP